MISKSDINIDFKKKIQIFKRILLKRGNEFKILRRSIKNESDFTNLNSFDEILRNKNINLNVEIRTMQFNIFHTLAI